MGLVENVLKKLVLDEAILIEKIKISASVFKIRLQGKSIKNTDFTPGYFLRLGIGIGNDNISFKDKVRSYSVWDINKTAGYLDLAIATDSNGIGSQWAINCKVGDTVYYKWKKGNFLVDDSADSYLMIGDLSALSHLYIFNRNLPTNKQVESLVYSHKSSDFFEDIDGSKPFNFHNLEANPVDAIVKVIKEITPKMTGNRIVYIAGDSRVCVELNHYFRNELQWETNKIKTKPFWNPDKKGLE
ncbi:siderophore-interacting protein [Flavobacterium algicola]|uniref:siderophore-interacting protein n=1 Tax=Flavobacterium algicola TaxID=556529 RepID=UPI001EFE81DA|nr:siderophore-interacting protein [Flavobacterium algicola]MCG9791876.1 siderophore-interacting protein [Flavobacterium algicola]